MGAGRALGMLAGTACLAGAAWTVALLAHELSMMGGTPGSGVREQSSSFTLPLALVAGGIVAMIGSRFIRKDP